MIIDLPETSSSAVAKKLIKLREEGGAIALGRVLTLIIIADDKELVEEAILAANDASSEHPCRVLVVSPDYESQNTRLDAQIRVGGDAGASEVIVLRPHGEAKAHPDTLVTPLLLPDAPIVAWWPGEAPQDPSQDLIGTIAKIRITDAINSSAPGEVLAQLSKVHEPGNIDLAWTRVTLWRGLLASTLELPPFLPVKSATVEGLTGHPSIELIAAWLREKLDIPVSITYKDNVPAITRVTLTRDNGEIVIDRPDGKNAILSQPGQPDHKIPLPVRQLRECLSEELRRLDPDEIYEEVLTKGLVK